MIEQISQTMIFILGSLAIFLISVKNKYGFIVGFLSQPFWLYASWSNRQWGIFILSIIYMISWLIGIYTHFKKL